MLDVDVFLRAWTAGADARALCCAHEFLAPKNAHRRYLMGRNEHALALSEVIDITGFVDDFAGDSTVWLGKPVMHTRDAPPDAMIVHCVFSQRPQTAWRNLSGARGAVALSYADLMRAAPDIVPLPNFVADMRSDVAANGAHWRSLHEGLADAQSRRVLGDLMRYRLTGDISFLAEYGWRVAEQYWDDVAHAGANAVFVDAGGFDGDTAEAFCKRYPDYRRAFVFEPSAQNMTKARARLAAYRDIVFEQRGLGAAAGRLRFDPASGSSSAASKTGSVEIEITTIDEAVREPASFIKMDIEGGEFDALRGAARQIAENAPTLALAVYHQARDFWRLKEFAMSLRPDYRVYLRHYTEGWAETVLYLVAR